MHPDLLAASRGAGRAEQLGGPVWAPMRSLESELVWELRSAVGVVLACEVATAELPALPRKPLLPQQLSSGHAVWLAMSDFDACPVS